MMIIEEKNRRLVYRWHCTNCQTNVEGYLQYKRRLCPLCGRLMNQEGAYWANYGAKKGGEKA
jgi:rRNA maturation endonuclease Nob1